MRVLFFYFSLFNYLTLNKILNVGKLWFTYVCSMVTKQVKVWAWPMAVTIETASVCNLACPHCHTGLKLGDSRSSFMSFDLFKKIVDEVHHKVLSLSLHYQGEPLLNPALPEMIRYATQKKMFVSFSTNANLLSHEMAELLVQSKLSEIIISFDGLTPDSYSKYRVGGDWQKVVDGIKALVACRSRLKTRHPFISLQFIVFKHNENEIEAFKALSKQLGADRVEFKTAQLYPLQSDVYEWMPKNRWSRYLNLKNGLLQSKKRVNNRCWRIWQQAVITTDGRAAACCFDKDLAHSVGNVDTSGFQSVWFGPESIVFKQLILQHQNKIEMCRDCV